MVGSKPCPFAQVQQKIGKFDITGIYHEDLDQLGLTESSFAIPQPKTRSLTLHVNRQFGSFGVDLGGIWAGQPLQGREFQVVQGRRRFSMCMLIRLNPKIILVERSN
jgi:hypothetical protein